MIYACAGFRFLEKAIEKPRAHSYLRWFVFNARGEFARSTMPEANQDALEMLPDGRELGKGPLSDDDLKIHIKKVINHLRPYLLGSWKPEYTERVYESLRSE